MQSTGTLVLVFAVFSAATSFSQFRFQHVRWVKFRTIATMLAFASISVEAWAPRALEHWDTIESLAVSSIGIYSNNIDVVFLSGIVGLIISRQDSNAVSLGLSCASLGMALISVLLREENPVTTTRMAKQALHAFDTTEKAIATVVSKVANIVV